MAKSNQTKKYLAENKEKAYQTIALSFYAPDLVLISNARITKCIQDHMINGVYPTNNLFTSIELSIDFMVVQRMNSKYTSDSEAIVAGMTPAYPR